MWINGGTIFDPVSGTARVGDIQVKDGLIEGVHPGGAGGTRSGAVDAKGLWVLPGLIDMHVHLRDPGFEYKEDIVSGSRAAAAVNSPRLTARSAAASRHSIWHRIRAEVTGTICAWAIAASG